MKTFLVAMIIATITPLLGGCAAVPTLYEGARLVAEHPQEARQAVDVAKKAASTVAQQTGVKTPGLLEGFGRFGRKLLSLPGKLLGAGLSPAPSINRPRAGAGTPSALPRVTPRARKRRVRGLAGRPGEGEPPPATIRSSQGEAI